MIVFVVVRPSMVLANMAQFSFGFIPKGAPNLNPSKTGRPRRSCDHKPVVLDPIQTDRKAFHQSP